MSRRLEVALVAYLALMVAQALVAGEVVGRYGGGAVLLRDWMVTYGLVVGGAQVLLALVLVAFSTGRARWLFLAAALAAIALLAFPFAVGRGPFPHEAAALKLLHVLVFAPAFLRACGFALLTRKKLAVALFATDAAVCLILGVTAALAVLPTLHPAAARPWLLAPGALAAIALLL